MKKTFYKLSVICALGTVVNLSAQEGKVGINTEEPTRVLDINGDLRVRTLDEPTTFEGVLVSENAGENGNETNVIRKAGIKLKQIFMGTFSTLGLTRTATTDPGKVQDGTSSYFMSLPALTAEAQQDLELTPDGKYYVVKKSGFYNIFVDYYVSVRDSHLEPFDGNRGSFAMTISVRTDAPGERILLASERVTIFRGAKAERYVTQSVIYNNPHPNDFDRLSFAGNGFFPKGSRIGIQAILNKLSSVVSDDSKMDNIKFAPPAEGRGGPGRSIIMIHRNL